METLKKMIDLYRNMNFGRFVGIGAAIGAVGEDLLEGFDVGSLKTGREFVMAFIFMEMAVVLGCYLYCYLSYYLNYYLSYYLSYYLYC
jgi:hypothetical protein